MQYGLYQNLYSREDLSVFEFLSIGTKGVIAKRIAFTNTEFPEVYNLVFGDIDVSGEINDEVVTNNGDRDKVLATIAHIIEVYLKEHPNRFVYFTGSTVSRNRLYRMAICANTVELFSKFEIYIQIGNNIVPFQKNLNLEGVLIRLKH